MKIIGKRKAHIVTTVIKTVIKLIATLLAVALQAAFYYFLFFSIYNLWYLQAALSVIGAVTVVWLYRRNLNPSYKLSWTVFILAVPLVGTVCYIIFGGGHAVPRRKAKKINAVIAEKIPRNDEIAALRESDARGAKLATTVYSASGFPLYNGTKSEFFSTAESKHERLLADLLAAEQFIYLEYFIISDGVVMDGIIDALTDRGNAGVKIKFLYDDVGSKKALSRKTVRRLTAIPNLELCVFEPVGLLINPRINYRDHRKIAIIDGKTGYFGGDNLADEYINRLVKYGHWRDNAIRIEGDAVYSLMLSFAETWYLSCGEKIELPLYAPSEKREDGYIQPFGDGPTNRADPAYHLFEGLISSAQSELFISTPYFIIDNSFISRVCQAALSGVDVRILLPHIPDKKFVFAVTRGHYGELIKSGVKVYEYTPGFNHAKTVISDGRYAFLGTVNCDYRSLMLHFENGALMIGGKSVVKMRDDFIAATEKSELITLEKWKSRSIFAKITDLLLTFLAPLL